MQQRDDAQPLLGRVVTTIVVAAVFVALTAFAWRGWYARYVRDDYCTAAALKTHGFLGAMEFHRATWSGRFSYFAIKAIPESIGPWTPRYVPGLMIVLFCAAAFWSIRRALRPPATAIQWLGALGFVYAVLAVSPDLLATGGPLIWETGAITYTLPLVLITAWLGLFATASRQSIVCTASAGLMFIAGGLSETSLAAQGALCGAFLVTALVTRAARQERIAAAGLAGTFGALAIVASAPGNADRMSVYLPPEAAGEVLGLTLRLAYDFVGSHVFVDGEALLLVLALFTWIGMRVELPNRVALLFAAAAGTAYIVSFLPGAWLMATGPPPRALAIGTYFLVAMVASVATAAGVRLAESHAARAVVTAALIACVWIPLQSARETIRGIPQARVEAREMEKLDALLRAQRGRAVLVRSHWGVGSRFFSDQRGSWPNDCIAEYYRLHSLDARMR
jgi:hypothetical protein